MSVLVAEINASANVQSFPGNGFGTVVAPFATDHLTTGSEVYTNTTCTATWTAGGEPNVGTSAGMLVVTQDGFWGVFVSGTATAVTVDKWRTRGGATGTPANGQDCRIINGACCATGSRGIYLHRIVVTNTAAGSLTVRDVWGNVLYTHAVLGTASPHVVEFCTGQGEPGLYFDRLVSFQSNNAGLNGTFVFGY